MSVWDVSDTAQAEAAVERLRRADGESGTGTPSNAPGTVATPANGTSGNVSELHHTAEHARIALRAQPDRPQCFCGCGRQVPPQRGGRVPKWATSECRRRVGQNPAGANMAGTVVGICGARLTDSERREAREGPRCDRHVIAPRKSGCCDRHKVRLWDEAHPRMGRPHSMRIRQDHTAIRDQILGLLMDGAWWTVWAMAEKCRCMETTASAKLRDLRKCRVCKRRCDIPEHRAYWWDIRSERLPESAAYRYRLAHPKREVE